MSAVIIDGKALAASLRAEISSEVKKLPCSIGLAVVMVGDNPSSAIYVRNKEKACAEAGITSRTVHMPENSSQEEVETEVSRLVSDRDINGILVQLPLPAHLDAERILKLIPPEKDVDGFSAMNVGNMFLGNESLIACTPHGIIKLIKYAGVDITGKHAVVVGRSNIVGKPVAALLLSENATVTVCHSKTKDLASVTRTADILVVAIGKAHFITADMVKEGAVVIDVGTNRVEGKLLGDVDFENVSRVAGYITPVPGGVGPMTITMLMYNTLTACKRANGLE